MSSHVSAILGQYMLKGWVLTDETCSVCNRIPLMRSPKNVEPVVHFCASCDGGPDSISSASTYSGSRFSRASTPPTEVSSTLSSPVFAPPPPTEESRRRAEQSDAASAEIGRRLLKGYAMLGEICPSPTCFGVPLVRPPKAGGEKDPRKECVICGNVYITEVDSGMEQLVLENTTRTPIAPSRGKARELEFKSLPEKAAEPRSLNRISTITQPVEPIAQPDAPAPATALLSSLDESAKQLESTLRVLSSRLAALTSGQSDPSSIGSVADAISKVVQALSQVRQLQWAEKHAGASL